MTVNLKSCSDRNWEPSIISKMREQKPILRSIKKGMHAMFQFTEKKKTEDVFLYTPKLIWLTKDGIFDLISFL